MRLACVNHVPGLVLSEVLQDFEFKWYYALK
jgi:hypothetical protein